MANNVVSHMTSVPSAIVYIIYIYIQIIYIYILKYNVLNIICYILYNRNIYIYTPQGNISTSPSRHMKEFIHEAAGS